MTNLSWPELFARIRPYLDLKGSGQPDRDGWVTARCIDVANHKNGDRHHSMRINVTTGGTKCMSQGCPVGTNMNTLAERLGVDGESPNTDGRDHLQRLAAERMLPLAALRDKYGVSVIQGGWAFLVDDSDAKGEPHKKRDPKRWASGKAPKNWWTKGAGVPASDLVYGLSHIPEGTETIYVAAGEIDAITLLEAGYKAVSFLAGETAAPSPKAIQKLVDHGITTVCLLYDKDEAGVKGATSLADACAREGLQVSIRTLPDDLGEGGDANDLWIRHDGDSEAFIEALEACPVAPHDSSNSYDSLGSDGNRRIQTVAEFLRSAEATANVDYLVDGLFPADWLLGLCAKPRVGKSMLALGLARSVVTGEPFLGRKTKQGPIVFLALEDPASLIKDRVGPLADLEDAHIYVGPWSDSLYEDFAREIRNIKPVLIVVDPLVSTYGGTIKDESDNAALAAHMSRIYALGREVGASVLCIHHQRKAAGAVEDTIRGGSAILAATHCMIVGTGSPERLKLTFLTKTMPVEPMVIKLGEELSWSVVEHEAQPVRGEDTVIHALRELKKASAAELVDFLGISRPAVNIHLAALQKDKRAVVVEKQGRTPVYGERSRREQQAPLSGMTPGGIHQESGGVD